MSPSVMQPQDRIASNFKGYNILSLHKLFFAQIDLQLTFCHAAPHPLPPLPPPIIPDTQTKLWIRFNLKVISQEIYAVKS